MMKILGFYLVFCIFEYQNLLKMYYKHQKWIPHQILHRYRCYGTSPSRNTSQNVKFHKFVKIDTTFGPPKKMHCYIIVHCYAARLNILE